MPMTEPSRSASTTPAPAPRSGSSRSTRRTCGCTSAGRRSTTARISATPGRWWSSTCSTGCCAIVYGADHVTYVRNITDVDDKINARARGGEAADPRADRRDRRLVPRRHGRARACCRPTHEPRATEYVPQMVAMIETLIARGHAYAAEGHVLFSVASYPGLRPLRQPLARRDAGRRAGRGGALQARPDGLRALEAVERGRARLAEPLGPRPAGLAHRVLGDERGAARGRPSTSMAAGSTSSSRTTRTRSPSAAAPIRRGSSRAYWLHNGFLNVEGREDVEVARQLLHRARSARPAASRAR